MMTPKTVVQVVFRNIGWKLLSLALAMLVWIAIYREPIIMTVLSAPVQFKNAPRDLEISSDILEAVDIETRGPSGTLRLLSEKRVAVVLDFSTVRAPGERTFTIERKNTNLPIGVEIVRIIPSQLRFTFERPVSRKVPVVPQVSGVLPKGLRLIKLESNPPELTITGPDSKVRGLASLHTDPVDLSGITEDRSVRVTAYLPNAPQLRFQDPPEVTVKVSVAKH